MGMKKGNFIKWGKGNYGNITDDQEYAAGDYVYANILNAILYQTSVVTKGIIESLTLPDSNGDYYTPAEITTAIDNTLNDKITLTRNKDTITLTVADTPKEITINNVSTAGKATYAANIAGGTQLAIPYQTDEGKTGFINKGLANEILRMNSAGNGFTWTSPNNLSVKSASNIAGGFDYQIPYQTDEGKTGFIGKPSTHYRVLTSTTRGFEWIKGADFMDGSLDLKDYGFIQRTGPKKYTTKAIFATAKSSYIKQIYEWFINSKTVRIFSATGGYQILSVNSYTDSGKDYYEIRYLNENGNIIPEKSKDGPNSSRTWTRVYFDV